MLLFLALLFLLAFPLRPLHAADDEALKHAEALRLSGSPGPARSLYEKNIPKLRAAGDMRPLADAVQHLSEIDLAQAKYADAVQRSSECRDLFHALAAAAGEVNCRSIEGRARVATGDFEGALGTYLIALRTARAKGLAEAEVALLNNTGNVRYFLGRYGDAARDYDAADGALAAHAAERWFARRHSITAANQATLFQRLGQYGKALAIYTRLRDTPQALLGTERTQMLVNMGTLYRRLGDPVKALEQYETARGSMGVGGDPASQISIAKNSGIALAFDLGKLPEALAQFDLALAIALQSGNRREAVQAWLYAGEANVRVKNWTGADEAFGRALVGARELHSVEDEWKCIYGLGRVRAARGEREAALLAYRNAIRVIEGIRAGAGVPVMRTGFLADKRDVYDAAIGILLDRAVPPADELFQLIGRAKARSFQDSVPQLSGGVPIDKVRSQLGAGTTVLDYWTSENRLAVIWIRASGWGVAQGRAPAQSELDGLTAELAKGDGDRWRELSAGVSPKLLPVPLEGVTSLVVVPDGALQLLPFDVLTVPGSGGRRILLEQANVSYVPASAFVTAKGQQDARWEAPWRARFVGFANPVGGRAGLMFASDSVRLPGSEVEVRNAAAALGGGARLHTGADNLKRYLVNAGHLEAPVLHLATHAVADTEDAERSRMVFSPDPESREQMDYLFTREIYRMDLRGVLLAVLSACDTERGVSIRGEGVESFSRALLAAGARTAITTFWKVGDSSSSQFWERFYLRLVAGGTVADALRSTKLEFYRSQSGARHPRYWSVYALNGSPDTRLPRRIPWSGLAAAGAVLFAILLFVRGRRRAG